MLWLQTFLCQHGVSKCHFCLFTLENDVAVSTLEQKVKVLQKEKAELQKKLEGNIYNGNIFVCTRNKVEETWKIQRSCLVSQFISSDKNISRFGVGVKVGVDVIQFGPKTDITRGMLTRFQSLEFLYRNLEKCKTILGKLDSMKQTVSQRNKEHTTIFLFFLLCSHL